MRKISISALLFPILLALTVPAGSQTRPRRVTQPETIVPVTNSETNSQERTRTVRARTPAIREGGARDGDIPRLALFHEKFGDFSEVKRRLIVSYHPRDIERVLRPRAVANYLLQKRA